jgi:hypothetical protein
MATIYNKIFSGYQARQMVEWRKNQRFEDHLHPYSQGTEVAGVLGCALANGDWWVESSARPVLPSFLIG